MADPFLDLSPSEAITRACEQAAAGDSGVWKYLDRYLRWRLLSYLQDREGDAAELRSAALEAVRRARAEGESRWEAAWTALLELLRDAEQLPATAADLEALQRPGGRAAEMLAVLAAHGEPMRPKELADRLRMQPQQVSNLAGKLEQSGLIVRQKRGRAIWIFPTARGLRLAPALPSPQPVRPAQAPEADELASEYDPWNTNQLRRAVGFD